MTHNSGPVHGRIRCTLLAALLAGLMMSPAAAQSTAPIAVELAATSPPVRLGEAMPTVWDIRKFQPGILNGHLELRVHLGTADFYRYTTDELVLHAADHRLRFLLPPVVTNLRTPEIEVDVTWTSRSGERFPLPMQIIRVPFTAVRTLMMGVIEERIFQSRHPGWDRRLNALKLESLGFDDGTLALGPQGRVARLQTVTVSWDPENTPTGPLNFLPYEVVAIAGNAGPLLKQDQLEALLLWCRGGGSLYLELEGTPGDLLLWFLNQLSAGTAAPAIWQKDSTGDFTWPASEPDSAVTFFCDHGRVVVLPQKGGDAAEMSRLCRFAWDWPETADPLQLATPQASSDQFQRMFLYADPRNDNLQRSGQIEAALMPGSVQIVPFPVIGLLLGGLVLLIGPIDWWVLGRLRMRRWTWITWPLATLACTLSAVMISNLYLQATDQARSLVVHDLGQNDAIVRTHQFDVSFSGRSGTATSSVEQALWQPIARSFEGGPGRTVGPVGTNAPFYVDPSLPKLAFAASYSGRVPAVYETQFPMKQWVPQLSYRLQFPRALEQVQTAWPGSRQLPVVPRQAALSGDLLQSLEETLQAPALIGRWNTKGQWEFVGTPSLNLSNSESERWQRLCQQLCDWQRHRGLHDLSALGAGSPLRHLYVHPPAHLQGPQMVLITFPNNHQVVIYRRSASA